MIVAGHNFLTVMPQSWKLNPKIPLFENKFSGCPIFRRHSFNQWTRQCTCVCNEGARSFIDRVVECLFFYFFNSTVYSKKYIRLLIQWMNELPHCKNLRIASDLLKMGHPKNLFSNWGILGFYFQNRGTIVKKSHKMLSLITYENNMMEAWHSVM